MLIAAGGDAASLVSTKQPTATRPVALRGASLT
jgi:hypothetical protein